MPLGEALHPATIAAVLATCQDDRLLEIQQSFLSGHSGSKRWEDPAPYGFFDALVDLTAYRVRDIYADTELDTQTLLAGPISLSAPRAPSPSENAGDRHDILAQGGPWAFWAKWYDAAMRGEPLPWDLQKAVALILEQIWRAGPEAVADEIARIEAEFELRQRIAEFEAAKALIAESRLEIGGNNPPQEIDDPQISQQVTILWESISKLKEEVEADQPDAPRVAELIRRLGSALKAVLIWCGGRANLAVDTTIKWSIPAGGTGYFYLNPAKAEAVLKAAQAWLPFLAP